MGIHPPGSLIHRQPWRALTGLLHPFRARLASGILISVLQCATALPMVWLIRRIFERTEVTAPSISLPVAGLYLVALAITTAALGILGQLLIHAPLLILDEPTNHVDQEGVRDLLLSRPSLQPPPAILVITHVPAVLALADEAWTLADGHLTPHRNSYG